MTALWTIPVLLSIGAVVLIAFTAFIFKGLDDQGEPLEDEQ
ncbi:hypothetical protein [Vreelandella aquamarina]|nr:hypothetical protein [Halomonas meridiana]